MIKLSGYDTSKVRKYEVVAEDYKELYEELQSKYDVFQNDELEVALAERVLNAEQIEKLEITTDGIENWDLFEELLGNENALEEDYKEAIENHDSQIYCKEIDENYEG